MYNDKDIDFHYRHHLSILYFFIVLNGDIMHWIVFLVKYRGFFYNGLFLFYALLWNFMGYSQDSNLLQTDTPHLFAGLCLFALGMSEGMVFFPRLKMALASDLNETLTANRATVLFLPPLLYRTLIGLIMAVTANQLISPDLQDKSVWSIVGIVAAILLLLKELIVLFVGMGMTIKQTTGHLSQGKVMIADLIILAYSCCIFSILTTRGFMFNNTELHTLFIAFITFGFGFVSLRLPLTLEEYLQSGTSLEKAGLLLSILFTVFMAVWTF